MADEYILTKKKYMQDIVRAIKSKDSSVNTLKIKNMDEAIQNISTEGKLPITLTGALKTNNSSFVINGHIGIDVTETGYPGQSTLKGDLKRAQVWFYGRFDKGKWWVIGVDYSNENGEFTFNPQGYGDEYNDCEEYKITYDGYGKFGEAEPSIIEAPTLTATVNGDSSTANLHLVEGDGLITLVNEEVVPNNRGAISASVEEGVDNKIIYKGQFTSLNTDNVENFKGITSIHPPKTVTSLAEFYFKNNATIQKLLLQDSQITVAPVLKNNTNLKVFRLPDTITEFGGDISNCHLDYFNIPGKNNPDLSHVTLLYGSTAQCVDIGSGFNQLLDSSHFGIDVQVPIENAHFIFPGKPIGMEVPNLRFDAPLRSGTYINARVDFQPDTERILAGSAAELGNVNRINIPIGCTYIEEEAFTNLELTSPGILRFESPIPPQFGENNDPEDCFPVNSVVQYQILCPKDSYDAYTDAFSSSSSYHVVPEGEEDYPLYSYKGEFCIEIIGDSLKSNPDCPFPFADVGGSYDETPYYLDDVVQDDYFNFDEPLDISFPYYGRHTLTVAGGFGMVEEEAFVGNKDIVKVRFPEGLYGVNYYSFAGCSNLRTLIFPSLDGVPTVIEEDDGMSFCGLHPDCKIYVPDSLEEDYRNIKCFNQYTIVPFRTSSEAKKRGSDTSPSNTMTKSTPKKEKESLTSKIFKAISYFNDEEDPLHDTIVMDGWDDLSEEEQRNYLISLLAGTAIAFTVGGIAYVLEMQGAAAEATADSIRDNINNNGMMPQNKEQMIELADLSETVKAATKGDFSINNIDISDIKVGDADEMLRNSGYKVIGMTEHE